MPKHKFSVRNWVRFIIVIKHCKSEACLAPIIDWYEFTILDCTSAHASRSFDDENAFGSATILVAYEDNAGRDACAPEIKLVLVKNRKQVLIKTDC